MIANVVLNNFIHDARVFKISKSLYENRFTNVIYALHKEGLQEREVFYGIHVHRVKIFTKKLPKWKPIQFIKYLEFIVRTCLLLRNNVDAVHCNDLNALPIGYLVKKISSRSVAIVYDCHEYETERDGMSVRTKKLLKFFERQLIRHVDAVFAVSDSIAECYRSDYSIDKPKVLSNCPKLQLIPGNNIFRDELDISPNKKIFLYQGGLKSGRGIEQVLEAFKACQRDDCVIVFMGFGPLDHLIIDDQKNYPNIYFYPAVSQDVLMNYTSSADFGILFYEDTCLNHRYCSPNKIFEYFMAEIPVVVSNLYEMRKIVKLNKVGVVAEQNTVDGFLGSVNHLMQMDYQDLKSNVLAIKQLYNWEVQEKVLLNVYRSL